MAKKYFIIAIALTILLLRNYFYFAQGAESGQDVVNINALVPAEGGEEGGAAGGGGGAVNVIKDSTAPIISDIQISEITSSSAKISWRTNELAVPQINYGRSSSYEKTFIGESYSMENSIYLENLSSGEKYYIEIIAADREGNRTSDDTKSFITLPSKKASEMENVSNLKAEAGDVKITLSWTNLSGTDFRLVKIFRSENFYPKNENEGVKIYEGNEEKLEDTNLENGKLYYYTVFAYNQEGDSSSGAVVKSSPIKYLPSSFASPAISPKPSASKEPSASPAPVATPTAAITPFPSEIAAPEETKRPKIDDLKIEDFVFEQNEKEIFLKEGRIRVSPNEEITINIPAGKVPAEAETMMIVLTKDNEEYSFLLKEDKKGKKYSAKIKLPMEGNYDVTIVVLDKENKLKKALSGKMYPKREKEEETQNAWHLNLIWLLILLIIIHTVRMILKMIKEARKKKAKN